MEAGRNVLDGSLGIGCHLVGGILNVLESVLGCLLYFSLGFLRRDVRSLGSVTVAVTDAEASAGGAGVVLVAGTGAGVGVTGEGVFHGSSTGLEAFQAATPAAAAAAMTVTINHPRFLGLGCSLASAVETALLAWSVTA